MNNPSESTEYDNAKFPEDKPKEEGDKLFFGKVNLDKINAGIIKGKEKVRRDTLSSVVEKLEGLKKPVHPDFEVNLENNGYNEALNNSIALIKEII